MSIIHVVLKDSSLTFNGTPDITVLNFALTLEHLENAFYQGALAQFDAKAFTDAGLPPFARGRFLQIADHEKTHVQFLSSTLGAQATQPCNYSLYVLSSYSYHFRRLIRNISFTVPIRTRNLLQLSARSLKVLVRIRSVMSPLNKVSQ